MKVHFFGVPAERAQVIGAHVFQSWPEGSGAPDFFVTVSPRGDTLIAALSGEDARYLRDDSVPLRLREALARSLAAELVVATDRLPVGASPLNVH